MSDSRHVRCCKSVQTNCQVADEADPQSAQLPSAHCGVLVTQKNSFGLFCLYDGDSLPISNDPEDQSGDCQPTTYRCEETLPTSLNLFHLYPNESSWHIGDWYWNKGTQKSKQSFKSLVGIITSADFRSEDLHHTNWVAINCQLGSLGPVLEQPQITSNTEEWQAEDSGWMQRSITISVPFPQLFLHPSPKNYTISNFYRQSLLSIICKMLSDPAHCRSFCFKPYLLRWQCSCGVNDIGVYGEIFSSQAFITAHCELQDIQLDPTGCSLP